MTSQAILPGAISREQRAEGVDLLPERGLFFFLRGLLDLALDDADLGLHARRDDDTDASPVTDGRPGEEHVLLVLDARGLGHGFRRLEYCFGLAS